MRKKRTKKAATRVEAYRHRTIKDENLKYFCNYCDCKGCKEGESVLSHGQTDRGDWICDVCYAYEVCLDYGHQPCSKSNCPAKPTMTGKWESYDEYKRR